MYVCMYVCMYGEGDMVLLRQNRENKLSPTFEPEPYRVVEKNGSAVIIENATGQSKMRNVGHMRKFMELRLRRT